MKMLILDNNKEEAMMKIGIPKEIKNNENRVAITPAGVEILHRNGHEVYIEAMAGMGSSFTDEEYTAKGAFILPTASDVWNKVDMVMKVKEPQADEFVYFRQGLILFTYLHLASELNLAKELINKGVIAIAYETIQLTDRSLPLLTPMSEVAGRMAVQIGAQFLEKNYGGKGILLSGVPGVEPAEVIIIGGGIVGTNAAKMALGAGAKVTILDVSPERLRYLDDIFGGRLTTLISNSYNIENAVKKADLLIGAVLIPGAKAPKLVKDYMVQSMSKGSVIVDVAIDQGGSIETIDRVTTHSEPTYLKHGVIHYAVANIPGIVPRTSTIALTNVTISYALQIAQKGIKQAILDNKALYLGVNAAGGFITYEAIAKDLGLEYVSTEKAFSSF